MADVTAGHRPSIARAISWLEVRRPGFEQLSEDVWRAGGTCRVIGVTGAPGSGKSTLTSALVHELRTRGRRVGIVAVDPSSTVSGGAILGDRIRMGEHTGDDGVFVRSLSSRGSLGGVSRATVDAVAVFDAAGYDDVIIETVGVGQAEVDVVRIAHSVLVVSVPGLGDEIQMIKAGLIEFADIHVVNKADRPEAHKLVADIKSMLTMAVPGHAGSWSPPVVETVATQHVRGIDVLADALDAHSTWLRSTDGLDERLRRGAEVRVREIAKELLMDALHDPARGRSLDDAVTAVVRRHSSPYTAASALVHPELNAR